MERRWLRGVWAAALAGTACGRSVASHDDPGTGGSAGSTPGQGGMSSTAGGSSSGSGSAGRNGGGLGGTTSAGSGGTGGTAGTDAPGGSGGIAGSGGCITSADELDGRSFVISGLDSITGVPDAAAEELARPTLFHFQKRVDGALDLIVGGEGRAFRGAVTEGDWDPYGPSLSSEDPLTLYSTEALYRGNRYQSGAEVTFTELFVCVREPDDSPLALRAEGRVHVHAEYDDYSDDRDGDVSLVGKPDTTPPSFAPNVEFDPLEPPSLRLTEPIALGASAWLSGDDEAVIDLTPEDAADTTVAFRIPSTLPLGFSAMIDADGRDLEGFTLGSGGEPVSTIDDPGVQPLDGFESELHAHVSYRQFGDEGESLVVGAEKALAGSQSLFVPAGAKVILHLERPAGTTTLHFDLRPVARPEQDDGEIEIRAGVIGGSEVVTAGIPIPTLYEDEGFGGAAGAAGAGSSSAQRPIEHVELALPEPGSDVILTIEAPFVELSISLVASAIVDGIGFE